MASTHTHPLITPINDPNNRSKTKPLSLHDQLSDFWPKQKRRIEALDTMELRDANRHQELPLARIKKIMKLDDDVKNQMISSEAPILFAKAAEMFIEELTLRAWMHTDENKRRTLQKSDISMAISRCEQFDFLIDIVPRDEHFCKQQSKVHNQLNQQSRMGDSESQQGTSGQSLVLDSSLLGGATPIPVRFEGGSEGQYFVQMAVDPTYPQVGQTMDVGHGESASGANPVIQLQNGQMVQATQIGQPIPFQTTPGHPVQLITVGDDGQTYQLQVQLSGEEGQIAEEHSQQL